MTRDSLYGERIVWQGRCRAVTVPFVHKVVCGMAAVMSAVTLCYALVVAKSMETGAKPRSIFQIAERASLAVPQVTPNPGVKMANINYAMPAKKVRALAQALGNVSLSYRDVGIKAFDRTYGDLVDDE